MRRKTNILLVEDNEGDILLITEAFKERKNTGTITVIKDGMEAVKYLAGDHAGRVSIPDLILLDINLPKIDGKEVLKYIKSNEQLKTIPVIIFTTSSSEKDITDCYNSYANCYITKPEDFGRFLEVVDLIDNFWTKTVQLLK